MKRILILPFLSSGLCFESHAFSNPSPSSIGGAAGSVEPKENAAARRIIESTCTTCSSENNYRVEGLSKLEAKSVQRFTTGYDKLCKTCPTLLRPRVDTLTEMIVGLSEDERAELMTNVARRLDEVGNERTTKRGIQTSRDTYDFQASSNTCMQVGLTAEPQEPRSSRDTYDFLASSSTCMQVDLTAEPQEPRSSNQKLIRKMEKARAKFEYNRRKAARARRLLACCKALLARDTLANEPTIYKVPNPLDNDIYHDIDKLKKLSRQELKLERLKLHSQKLKFESKVSKARLKLYGASRALVMTAT